MAFRIYTKGNYFIINDDVNNIEYEGLRKEVIVRKQSELSEDFFFSNVNSWKDPQGGINITDILDELGNNYSLASFITFYTENTGNFNGGGATPLITSVENGLYLDGAIAKLGGELTQETTIFGNNSLFLGKKNNEIDSIGTFTLNDTTLSSSDGATTAELNLSPYGFSMSADNGMQDSGLVFQTMGLNGILVKDYISNVGLRGVTQFNHTDNLDYVQKYYVDAIATGALIPKGTWNSLTNTPTLTSSTSPGGNYLYVVSVASSGVTTLDGESVFNVGDTVFFSVDNGIWYRIGTNFTLQDLQQVTDLGNTTTNSMMITDGVNYELTISPSAVASNLSSGSSFSISPDKVEIINLSGVTSISQGNIFFNNTGGNELSINAGSIIGIKNHNLPNDDGTYAVKARIGLIDYSADSTGTIILPQPPKRNQTVEWINGNYSFTANQWSTQNITSSSFLYGPTNLLVGTTSEPPTASVEAVTGSHILVPFGNSKLKRVRFSCGLPQIIQNRSFDIRIYGSRMNPTGTGRIGVQLLAFGNNLANGTSNGIFMYDLNINPQTPLTDDTYITMFIRDKLNNNHRGITINFEFEEV